MSPNECAKYMSTVKLDSTALGDSCALDQRMECDTKYKYRSIDGTCNNLKNPKWGSAFTAYGRFLFPQYADGKNIISSFFLNPICIFIKSQVPYCLHPLNTNIL